jgi:hypothetical protein
MKGFKYIHISLENKETQWPARRGFLLTWPSGKKFEQKYEKDNVDMESI